MSTIKRDGTAGQITASGEWKKHLRKFWKRKFWKSERATARAIMRALSRNHPEDR